MNLIQIELNCIILEEIMHKDVKITGKNGFVLLDIC